MIIGYNRAYVKESDEGFLDQMYEYFTADLGGGIGCPDIKDAMVDYQFLENPADPEYLKVLFVAASKEDAIYMLSEIKKAGLSPVIFDSNASALLNAYSFFNHKSQAKDVVACVHWGAEYVIINLFWGGMPQRIRVMSLGGNHIADAIRDQLKVSYEEAEAIKLKKKKGAAQNAEVEKIFSWASEELTKLVRGQVEFFFAINNHHSDLELKKIFISGGCSRIQGLPGIMEKKLGVPVEIFNPFSKITIDPGDFDPTAIKDIVSFAPVALGLALRGGTSNLSRINLLRPLRGE
jgi:type IV pilus assembly protein PilM